MRHRKHTAKLGRNTSHRRCLMANMLKSLVTYGQVETTVAKAKELRRHADRLVTWAKKGTLALHRRAIAKMMIRYNTLNSKKAKRAKSGDKNAFNDDRMVMEKLTALGLRFTNRNGGYTRIIRTRNRVGDNSPICVIQYVEGETLKVPETAEKDASVEKKAKEVDRVDSDQKSEKEMKNSTTEEITEKSEMKPEEKSEE